MRPKSTMNKESTSSTTTCALKIAYRVYIRSRPLISAAFATRGSQSMSHRKIPESQATTDDVASALNTTNTASTMVAQVLHHPSKLPLLQRNPILLPKDMYSLKTCLLEDDEDVDLESHSHKAKKTKILIYLF